MDVEYPHFLFVEPRGQIFPGISLPADYRERMPSFYSRSGREWLETFAKQLENGSEGILGKPDIRLQWDDQRGLVNISIGPSGGLDLNEWDRFQEHNLGTSTSLITGAIVINYVYELLRSLPDPSWIFLHQHIFK